MLFKFKSQAASDLIMLEADGRRLLHIMLGDDPAKGIIVVQDLPQVILRLETAVAQDEAARQQQSLPGATRGGLSVEDSSSKEQTQALDPVRLAQRASPMLKLLKRCQAEESDVVWGV